MTAISMSALYKAFKGGRPVFFALALGILLAGGPASANSYTVEGVTVDAVAANAVQAREKALTQAQVKAFEQLAAQTLTPEELAVYTMPDADTIMALVQDFEVTNEQLSTKRYKGTFTVRFRPALAAQYLRVQPAVAQPVPEAVIPQQQVQQAPVAQQPNPATIYQQQRMTQQPVAPVYQQPAIAAGQPVMVRARFASVQEWVRLKNVLERNRTFAMRRIVALQPREALVELGFNGAPAELQQALTGAGLSVSPAQSVAVDTASPLFDVGFGGYSRY